MKSGQIQIRLEPDIKKQIEQVALEEGRSLSNLIAWLIVQHLKTLNK